MKLFAVLLAVLPTFTFAEEIVLAGKVTDVILYPQGATVTRNIPFQAAAGTHTLVITGIPADSSEENLRVTVSGATMGIVTERQNFVPPRDDATNAELEAARAVVTAIEGDIRKMRDEIKAIGLQNEAVAARITFLRQIGEGDKLANTDLEVLRDISRMIGAETLAAREDGHKAEIAARVLEDALALRQEDLETAQKQVAALVPEDHDFAYMAIEVSSDEAINGAVQISSFTRDAEWGPTYDMRLNTDAPATLVIDRAARVWQGTGENWQGVNLELSTLRPSGQLKPSYVYAQRRRIEKPAPPEPSPMVRSMAESSILGPIVFTEEPSVMSMDFDGLSVTYGYPIAIDIASRADELRIDLGRLETGATLHARAIPRNDETGFLMAEFTNDMGELILPSGESAFFLDGRFVGNQEIDGVIATGAEATLSFGPIEGLRLTRKVVDRNEGDTGFVSRVNERVELAEIGVENLTGRAWDVRLLDRVPYSEQEDLVITWRSKPMPNAANVEGRRGILQWDFTLAPQERKDITLSHRIEWPSGMELR
ncbi:MAG: DUF4139 domain-containing protein [Rhodobacterales bacterium]|nr:DUF4139 domain-containing protein [Rhodobacterales bacterium]